MEVCEECSYFGLPHPREAKELHGLHIKCLLTFSPLLDVISWNIQSPWKPPDVNSTKIQKVYTNRIQQVPSTPRDCCPAGRCSGAVGQRRVATLASTSSTSGTSRSENTSNIVKLNTAHEVKLSSRCSRCSRCGQVLSSCQAHSSNDTQYLWVYDESSLWFNDESMMSLWVYDESMMSLWWVYDESMMSLWWVNDESMMSLWWVYEQQSSNLSGIAGYCASTQEHMASTCLARGSAELEWTWDLEQWMAVACGGGGGYWASLRKNYGRPCQFQVSFPNVALCEPCFCLAQDSYDSYAYGRNVTVMLLTKSAVPQRKNWTFSHWKLCHRLQSG